MEKLEPEERVRLDDFVDGMGRSLRHFIAAYADANGCWPSWFPMSRTRAEWEEEFRKWLATGRLR